MGVPVARPATATVAWERRAAPTRAPRAELCSLRDALALGPAVWDALVCDAPIGSPFARWAWQRAWADAAPAADVAAGQALVLRGAGGRVQGLLPLRLHRTHFRRAPVTALGWACGDLGCPDHLDLPALPDADHDALVAALDRLPWDVAVLDNLAERAPNADRLCAAAAARGWTVRRAPLFGCPHLALPRDWDAYLAGLTPTRRQTIRRKERSLLRAHAVTLTDYGPDRWTEGWRHLTRLHERRWNGPGALGTPEVERLHAAYAAAAGRGAIWLSTLDLDGTPAAAWYGFAVGDTVSFYQGGRDLRWERESVGAVLMGMMIRRAIERGYRTFDFLRGEEPYKTTWTSTTRVTFEVVLLRPGLKGAALRLLDRLAAWRGGARPDGGGGR
jgi:CelD/BcsL family acetyltransferase involved in cellulose biosynthesis